jgi:hypothetical protein
MATTRRARAKRTATSEPIAHTAASGSLTQPINQEDELALRRFLSGESLVLVKADPAHMRVISQGMWLRVKCVGPDWFAVVAN